MSAYQHTDALAKCYAGPYDPKWGDLHSHTSHSDDESNPQGEPGEAFGYARNTAGMDFLAITDHVNAINPTEWQHCRDAAENHNDPDSFVAFCGFEIKPGHGHSCVFWTDGDIFTADSRGEFYGRLESHGESVAQINHPLSINNPWAPFPYDAAPDDHIALCEFNGDGGFLQLIAAYAGFLDAGWHLGPSLNGDYHQKGWGDAPKRTGLWVSKLSRPGVREAMVQRRSFSSPANGAWIRLIADGCWMGSVIGGVTSANVVVDVQLEAATPPLAVQSIHLIGRGNTDKGTFASCVGAACTYAAQVDVQPGDYVFAYARRSDGRELVSSPVWFRNDPTCTGECVPGAEQQQPCGNCGVQRRRCRGNCTWSDWQACEGQGECSPGESGIGACGFCGTTSRVSPDRGVPARVRMPSFGLAATGMRMAVAACRPEPAPADCIPRGTPFRPLRLIPSYSALSSSGVLCVHGAPLRQTHQHHLGARHASVILQFPDNGRKS